jgi:hypothetical protein
MGFDIQREIRKEHVKETPSRAENIAVTDLVTGVNFLEMIS